MARDTYLYILLPLNLLFSLIGIKYSKSNTRFALSLVIIFTMITEYRGRWLAAHYIPNASWINLNIPILYASVVLLYFIHFSGFKTHRIIMGLSVITLMIIGWGYLLSNPESTEFNDLAALLKGLFLIAIGLTYFVGYLVQSTELKITRESLFWVTIGFIVFEAGSFFQTAFLNAFILQDLQIGKRILGDINVFNCLLHGFILIGILVGILRARENKNTTSNLSL